MSDKNPYGMAQRHIETSLCFNIKCTNLSKHACGMRDSKMALSQAAGSQSQEPVRRRPDFSSHHLVEGRGLGSASRRELPPGQL